MQADNIKITQELEASKRDEEELETFIETRQKELEDWKKDEAETSEKLERIRLDASASQQQETILADITCVPGVYATFGKGYRLIKSFSSRKYIILSF